MNHIFIGILIYIKKNLLTFFFKNKLGISNGCFIWGNQPWYEAYVHHQIYAICFYQCSS